MGRRRGSWTKLSPEVRREVMRLAAKGCSHREIAGQVSVSLGSIGNVLRPLGGVIRREMLEVTGRRLCLAERVEVRVGLAGGESVRAIAARLGRAPSTVSREVEANGGPDGYRPVAAQRAATVAARRPKVTKLGANPALCQRVIADLEQLWSPQQIAARLAGDFGDDESMRISHETIYKSLYLQGRGELRRELARCLRTGRAARKPQGRTEKRGRIVDMTMIAERPAEVADRAVPGHWEGDLIIGKNGRSAIGTMVERTTRFTMLLHLPHDHGAVAVRDAITAAMSRLPQLLRQTLTWDQGIELTRHAEITAALDLDIYFCDPHSPWQRGTNENTNGLLRQYFPKRKSLAGYTQAHLDDVAERLNGRPRQTLGFLTPSQVLERALH